MIPFKKPGSSAPYHVMGAQAARLALADAGLDYARGAAGLCRASSTAIQHQRPARTVRGGHDGHPDREREQQLLQRLDRALYPGPAGDRGGLGGLRAGAWGSSRCARVRSAPMFDDRPSVFEQFDAAADALVDAPGVPLALRQFGGAGLSHMRKVRHDVA